MCIHVRECVWRACIIYVYLYTPKNMCVYGAHEVYIHIYTHTLKCIIHIYTHICIYMYRYIHVHILARAHTNWRACAHTHEHTSNFIIHLIRESARSRFSGLLLFLGQMILRLEFAQHFKCTLHTHRVSNTLDFFQTVVKTKHLPDVCAHECIKCVHVYLYMSECISACVHLYILR